VTWSVLYAFFFFMPLMSILGPEHALVEKNTTEEKKVEMKVDAEI